MITFDKWIRKSDRTPLASISVRHTLDLEELGTVLAFAANREIAPVEWLDGLSASRAEKSIRNALKYSGYDTIIYAEDTDTDVLRAGLDAAARLWPKGLKND